MRYIILFIFVLLFWTTEASAQVAVIAHKSVPVDSLKKIELLDFYTGDIRVWEDEHPVVVFDLKTKGNVRDSFYHFLGKTSSRMKSIWMKKMLSGEGDPPEAMKSQEEVLKKVSTTPGAIGFVSHPLVTDEVKMLLVIQLEDDS